MKVFRVALIVIVFFSVVGVIQCLGSGNWFRLFASILSAFTAFYVYRKTKAMPKGDEWGWALHTPTWFMWLLVFTFLINSVDSFMAANTWSLRHETVAVVISGAFGLAWLAFGLFLAYLTATGLFKLKK